MRIFLTTVSGIIGIIILAACVIGFIFWSRVPDMLANNLSNKLKVSVEVDAVDLSWGDISIKKVVIGNPPGSILSEAFSCRRIDILAPFHRFFNQQIVIDQINISDVYLGLEFASASSTDGNWSQIMKNVTASEAEATRKSQQEGENAKGASKVKSVLIKSLVLTNINVDVVYRKEGGKVQKLPPIDRIELTNITSEGGLPMDQIMNSVLGQMLKAVFTKQNLQNMLQGILDPQNDTLKNLIQPFKGFFNTRYVEGEEKKVS